MSIRHFVYLKYNNLEKAHGEVVIKNCIRVPNLVNHRNFRYRSNISFMNG